MNTFVIITGLLVVGVLFAALRSDAQKQRENHASDESDSDYQERNTKPVKKLSPHDAAVWLDDFLVRQQEDAEDNEE